MSAPSISMRSARRSNGSATSGLRGRAFATRPMIGRFERPLRRRSVKISRVRACVCLPTYNEAENLERMLRALGERLGPDDVVLVIDDNSPDGTGRMAQELAGELPFVHVLHRARKEGLGPAYIAGFHWALDHGAALVLEMDCDFSHDPADVPRLIAAVEGGADLALGSRYVPGGRVGDWGLIRRGVSRDGSLYAALWLRLGVKDRTGG